MSRHTFEPGPGHPDYEPTQEEIEAAQAVEDAETLAAPVESGDAAEGESN